MSFLFLLAVLLAPQARTQPVSQDDLKIDYGNKDYRAVIRKTNRLFSGSTQEPMPAEKYQLLMLRGEAQLQVKERLGAIASFKSAAKCAGDVNEFASANANALIVEKSSMGKFTPKLGSTREPIDIVPPESRREAMAILQAELWAQNKAQIDTALRATTLPPIEKAFVPLSNVFFLEMAAKGQATETDKVMRDLGQHTYQLMQTEVTRYSRGVDQLSQAANSSSGGDWSGVRRGLISTERNELKDNLGYLAKLRDRASEYRGIASKLGGNEQRWDALVADIIDVLNSTENLSNDR